MKEQDKGSIYLLMGYLGSGKTTFIRNLLNNKHGVKYAVVQNEFSEGQMGIEQPLIMDESGTPFSNFLELPNGCICCSAKNDLIASVQYILNNTDVRNIICETNGLADPGQSIKQFWFDQEMKINAQLHSIISIISVRKYTKIKEQQLFNKQIAFANKILITFLDQSTPEEVQNLEKEIKQSNDDCLIAKNDSYNVIDFLSGGSMFDINALKGLQGHGGHHHHGIDSIFIKEGTLPFTKNQFQCKIGQLLWQSQLKVMRIKGAISLKDSDFVYELQGVDEIFEIKDTKTSKDKFDSQTRILVIGQSLTKEKLYDVLKLK